MNKLIFKLFYKKTFLLFFILMLIPIFLNSCVYRAASKSLSQIPAETAKMPQVYFCPKEDCGKIVESHISSANSTVYCAFYDLKLKNIIGALARKSKDADVKVVIDSSNQKGQIKGDGVRVDDDKQLMHNKFCVFDDDTVITGSFNPTDNDNSLNNNNLIVVYSKTLAKNYKDEFDELWNGQFGRGSKVEHPVMYINGMEIENYFCPEDKCASRIIGLISNAKSSVYFMSFSFTNNQIADAIIKKKNLDVRGIFDLGQSSSKFSQFNKMNDLDINVKKDKNKYKLHHKVFIIDNQTVATGSFNPTLSADTKNDENLIIFHDQKIANEFVGEFNSLWQ